LRWSSRRREPPHNRVHHSWARSNRPVSDFRDSVKRPLKISRSGHRACLLTRSVAPTLMGGCRKPLRRLSVLSASRSYSLPAVISTRNADYCEKRGREEQDRGGLGHALALGSPHRLTRLEIQSVITRR